MNNDGSLHSREIEAEIEKFMPAEQFLRIQKRLEELRGEEDARLKALAQLQQYYVAARTEQEEETVRQAVAEIRELSRKTRQEIRTLNSELVRHMTLEQARDLYARFLRESHSPK